MKRGGRVPEDDGGLAEATRLYSVGEFGLAYGTTRTLLEQHPLSVELLLLHARTIQMLDQADLARFPEATLERAYECLQRAARLAPRNADALLELGSFEFAVRDRADLGLRYLDAAGRAAGDVHREALVALAKCLKALGRHGDACETVHRLGQLFPEELFLRPGDLDLWGEV